MHFSITVENVELIEPDDVGSFSVVRAATMTDEEFFAAVEKAGLGRILDGGEHVLVPVSAIRRMAAGRVGDGWHEAFGGMVRYAASKGWMSDDGTGVRAHVERQ